MPIDIPEVARASAAGVPVIGELELASRWLRGPIVAITGTKGKSTTTTLVGRMLEAAGRRVLVGGNIGYPVSAQVDALDRRHGARDRGEQLSARDHRHVPAVDCGAPELLTRSPRSASGRGGVCGGEAADLRQPAAGRLGGRQCRQRGGDSDGDECAGARRDLRRRTDAADVHVGKGFVWQRTSEGDIPLLPLAAVQLQGRHMLSNVVAATAISHLAGASSESLARALDGFHGLEHVMELVATHGGVRFVNDSKATNVDAAAKSIESFDKVVAIIGGKYKGGDFADLAAPLRAHGRAVVAIGEARPMVKAALKDVVPVVEASTLAEAVRRAWDLAVPDGVVLLAPACSSFDMFADYADRGRQFKEEVQKADCEARACVRAVSSRQPVGGN